MYALFDRVLAIPLDLWRGLHLDPNPKSNGIVLTQAKRDPNPKSKGLALAHGLGLC